ncbi:MAG: TIGR03546 family protein [Gammaproteobacteria bacterium]
MLRLAAKVLRVLNSEADPSQIADAVCLGAIMGLTPLWSPHNLIVLFLVLVLRVNLSSFIAAWGLFTAFAYALDPLFDRVGLALLTSDTFKGLWTLLYNTTAGRLSHFNNSVLLGSLVASVIGAIPLYFLTIFLIRRYRLHVQTWIRRMRLVQAIKASNFWRIYSALRG